MAAEGLTIAYAALVLASIADVVTTMRGVRSGLLREVNPLMRWFTRTTARAVAVKVVALLVSLVALQIVARTAPTFACVQAWLAAGFTASIAARNAALFRRESENVLENFSTSSIPRV